jgi:hypothetical protein
VPKLSVKTALAIVLESCCVVDLWIPIAFTCSSMPAICGVLDRDSIIDL